MLAQLAQRGATVGLHVRHAVVHLDRDAAAGQAPELVARLGESIQIPRGLGAIGMKREQLNEMAELASGIKRLLDNSPVSFDQDALLHILEDAY